MGAITGPLYTHALNQAFEGGAAMSDPMQQKLSDVVAPYGDQAYTEKRQAKVREGQRRRRRDGSGATRTT